MCFLYAGFLYMYIYIHVTGKAQAHGFFMDNVCTKWASFKYLTRLLRKSSNVNSLFEIHSVNVFEYINFKFVIE